MLDNYLAIARSIARRARRPHRCALRKTQLKPESPDLLDTYRLLGGVAVDLRPASVTARHYLMDLALRLAQGQGYEELLVRVQRPDVPLYEGHSPLSPVAADLPALRAARDLVYRAGLAEGHIVPGPGEANLPLWASAGRSALGSAVGSGKLTTEPILTVGEAMDMLGITRQAVINAVHSGRVRGEQHGKLWVLSREDVLRYRMARDDRRLARLSA